MTDPPCWDSELGSVRARFDDTNPLVDVALGLLSASSKLDALLAEHASEASAVDAKVDATTEAGAAFVLGLIAFQERLRRALAQNPASAVPANSRPPATESLGDSLLR